MASPNLQIPDIAAAQDQKEVTHNEAVADLDNALNQKAAQKTITTDTAFTTLETRENIVVELIGTPGTPRNIDMPDTNERFMTVVNNTDDVMTIRNSASGGSGQPVLAVGQAAIFQYNGTNFFDYMALFLAAASNFLALTDTPSAYTNLGGQQLTINTAENAVEATAQHAKIPVRVATTANLTLSGEQTVDGVLTSIDRICVKDQSTGAENGLYVTAVGAWTRSIDMDDNADVILGATIPVLLGDTNARSVWMHTAGTDIGTDTLTFLKTEPAIGYMPLPLGTLRDIVTNDIDVPLNAGTTPRFERINLATDKGLRVIWETGNLDEVAFPEVYMSPDIDADKDLTIHLVGEMSGGTDTTTSIDVQVFDSSGDTEMGGSTGNFTSTRTEFTITITAANLTGHPLGWISISLVPAGAHAADTLQITSAWIEYTRKVA